jgi:hypothetical protein
MSSLRWLAVLTIVAGALLVTTENARAGLFAKTSSGDAKAFEAVLVEGGYVASDKCCGTRCITYRDHCRCKKTCCDCAAPIQVVLQVKDPCRCCFVEVPVCVPACCKGVPEVSCGRGLLCRDTVTYSWCCGFRVKVVFDRCGDLIVHTYGAA